MMLDNSSIAVVYCAAFRLTEDTESRGADGLSQAVHSPHCVRTCIFSP